MQCKQHLALYEVQYLCCGIVGPSDEEITIGVEGQVVHHTTVDWKTHICTLYDRNRYFVGVI